MNMCILHNHYPKGGTCVQAPMEAGGIRTWQTFTSQFQRIVDALFSLKKMSSPRGEGVEHGVRDAEVLEIAFGPSKEGAHIATCFFPPIQRNISVCYMALQFEASEDVIVTPLLHHLPEQSFR